jgi:uncharacterized protein (DUF58 family)
MTNGSRTKPANRPERPAQPLAHELLDWGSLSPLRLNAQRLADGAFAGAHKSQRRGSGVEFDGHRDYVPGDDLRRLDFRALMRHGRLLIRQFESETERRLCLMLDCTRSMAFKSEQAPAAKLAFAALLAAALGRVAVATGDQVALDWLGGEQAVGLPASGGKEAFERLVSALESVRVGGDETLSSADLDNAMQPLARRAVRGSVVVLFSDLVDLPEGAARAFATLSTRMRTAIVVRVLDPLEARFPFDGSVRLKSSWGQTVVETDASQARAGYLQALSAQFTEWQEALVSNGGRAVDCCTDEPPLEVVRRILTAIEGQRR